MKKYLFLILSVAFIFLGTEKAMAGLGDNVSGYAWSENIGWISLNCTNDASGISCKASNYGVNIDQKTGDFSGYAWSENIGWISFNKDDVAKICCINECGANYSFDTQEVTGFARVVSAGGGLDGCLKLRGEWRPGGEYGLSISPEGKFSGWAWSDEVLGWVSFSHLNCDSEPDGSSDGGNYPRCPEKQEVSEYQAIFSFDFNTAPEAKMNCSVVDCGGSGCVCPGDTWETYNQGGDDSNAIFEILNESTDPDRGDSIASSDWKLVRISDESIIFHMTCPGACNYTVQDHEKGNYRVELEVFDQKGKSSGLISHPLRIKQEAIADFECSLVYSEDPREWKPCDDVLESLGMIPGTAVYLKDDLPAPHNRSIPSEDASEITKRTWIFNGIIISEGNSPTTSILLESGPIKIELKVEDELEVCFDPPEEDPSCLYYSRDSAIIYSFRGSLIPAPPAWKEISHASFKEKVLSFFHKLFRA